MKKTHTSPLFIGLIMIVLGVILVLYSGQAMATILRITAVGFLVVGAVGIAASFWAEMMIKRAYRNCSFT